jgi:hypothetical protein
MPSYDYRCSATGDVFEVRHGINDKLHTWAELCDKLQMALGKTAAQTPIERLATGGAVVRSSSLKNPEAPPCASAGCSGSCGV